MRTIGPLHPRIPNCGWEHCFLLLLVEYEEAKLGIWRADCIFILKKSLYQRAREVKTCAAQGSTVHIYKGLWTFNVTVDQCFLAFFPYQSLNEPFIHSPPCHPPPWKCNTIDNCICILWLLGGGTTNVITRILFFVPSQEPIFALLGAILPLLQMHELDSLNL